MEAAAAYGLPPSTEAQEGSAEAAQRLSERHVWPPCKVNAVERKMGAAVGDSACQIS
jgi:hypothetical protein